MAVLVIAEHDNLLLAPATRAAVSAARQLDGSVTVLVAGRHCGALAESAALMEGVGRVLVADAPHHEHLLAENLAPQVAALAGGFTHLLAPATAFGRNLMPRVAALLDVAPVTDVVAIESPDTFVRPLYAGNVLATVRCPEPVKVLTTRPSAFDAAPAAQAPAPLEYVTPVPDSGLSRFVGAERNPSKRPGLTTARVVVAGGRGVGSAAGFRLIEALADRLGAALGASRAAVDLGFIGNDHQVGQTGQVVAPELYIAVGISGAIQHLAGMRESRVIVAINNDPEAPIFQVADYGLVADLHEALPALIAALEGGRG